MNKVINLKYNVVQLARQRIISIFKKGEPVVLSFSGGKDSIVLADITYKLCQEGKIDPKQLTVCFIDEEAIYDCVEKITMQWRKKFMMIGAKFEWWCIECRHFNCLNMLQEDESFICWDRYKSDCWVRQKPSFALGNPPDLLARCENYQSWSAKHYAYAYVMIGTRIVESVQRKNYIAGSSIHSKNNKCYPIYDMKNQDIWLYIKENNLDFPEVYIYLYQTGAAKNQLRISQFFSPDTIKSLVKMNEFYPDLFKRIEKREPNAYMVALYFDTELFRREKKGRSVKDDTPRDYKKLAMDFLKDPKNWDTKMKRTNNERLLCFIRKFNAMMPDHIYKKLYNALVGGDPKSRTLRNLYQSLFSDTIREDRKYEQRIRNSK